MDASRQEAAPHSERSALFLCCLRIAVLVAVAFSAALYSQYLNPAEGTFCADSGCEAVRHTAFAYFGSPLLSIPLVGLLAFGALYAVSLVAPNGRALRAMAVAGGLAGLALILTQAFVVGAFCWLCLVVDTTAIACAAFAVLHARSGPGALRDPLRLAGWGGLFSIAVIAPFAWASVKPEEPVPQSIRELYVAGKVNVVEFADFECPYCRRLHPSLKRVLEEQPPERIHFVRGHVPLPSHTEAKPAARGAICAEEQGLGPALADRLVEIELTPAGVRRAAIEVGADAARFDECLASTRPDARIEADTARLKAAGMRGLPTTYVGGERLLGAVSEAKLRDAIARASEGEDTPSGVPAPVFLGLLALAMAAVAWLGKTERATLAHEPRD